MADLEAALEGAREDADGEHTLNNALNGVNMRMKSRIEKLEADLAFADSQAAKVEVLLEPHVKWDDDAAALSSSKQKDGE